MILRCACFIFCLSGVVQASASHPVSIYISDLTRSDASRPVRIVDAVCFKSTDSRAYLYGAHVCPEGNMYARAHSSFVFDFLLTLRITR